MCVHVWNSVLPSVLLSLCVPVPMHLCMYMRLCPLVTTLCTCWHVCVHVQKSGCNSYVSKCLLHVCVWMSACMLCVCMQVNMCMYKCACINVCMCALVWNQPIKYHFQNCPLKNVFVKPPPKWDHLLENGFTYWPYVKPSLEGGFMKPPHK